MSSNNSVATISSDLANCDMQTSALHNTTGNQVKLSRGNPPTVKADLLLFMVNDPGLVSLRDRSELRNVSDNSCALTVNKKDRRRPARKSRYRANLRQTFQPTIFPKHRVQSHWHKTYACPPSAIPVSHPDGICAPSAANCPLPIESALGYSQQNIMINITPISSHPRRERD